jgi:hypothetical protein
MTSSHSLNDASVMRSWTSNGVAAERADRVCVKKRFLGSGKRRPQFFFAGPGAANATAASAVYSRKVKLS